MRILICDDEPAMVKQISEIIADAYPDIELVGVHSSAELSEKLAPEDANRKFDLAFLDIAVSDESGVDIAEFVGALCPRGQDSFRLRESGSRLEGVRDR